MSFVINLISTATNNNINHYGYWTGKHYVVNGEYYPVCDKCIGMKTKIYKSKKVAEKSANACVERYGYVSRAEVEEIL